MCRSRARLFWSYPGINDEVNSVEDKTKVFTYALDFKKLKDDTAEYVEGARFKLEYKSPDGRIEKTLAFKKTVSGGIDIYTPNASSTDPDATEIVTNGREIRFYGLDAGSYKLTETGAPSGYALLRDPIVFTITPVTETVEETKIVMTGTAIIKTTNTVIYDDPDDVTLGHDGVNANLILRNYEGVSIPETGSVASLIIMIVGGIVIIGGIIFFVLKSKKDRDDDDDDEE